MQTLTSNPTITRLYTSREQTLYIHVPRAVDGMKPIECRVTAWHPVAKKHIAGIWSRDDVAAALRNLRKAGTAMTITDYSGQTEIKTRHRYC